MAIRLVFLGRLEDVAGEPMREVATAPLAALVAALEPGLARAIGEPRIRLAVNGVLVADRASVALGDGDEVAFFPPVSGG